MNIPSIFALTALVTWLAQTQPRPDTPTRPNAGQPATSGEKSREPMKAEADLLAMSGTWQASAIEEVTRGGVSLPPKETKITYVIAHDKLMTIGDDGCFDQATTIRLDPTQQPKAIDLDSPRTGVRLGIYQLEGDILRIHESYQIGRRPTEFPAKSDQILVLKRVSRTPLPALQRFPNSPGCYWVIDPTTPPASMSGGGVIFIYEKDREGAAFITLAGAAPPEYRPVLLDGDKKRFLPEIFSGGGLSSRFGGPVVALSRWRMDPKILSPEKVSLIGIEAVTTEFHRLMAREAMAEARKLGVEAFPYPEIGQPFEFTLTTIDGKTIRSQDLRGKVVVIDCWANWCAPCMALLPEVKELHRKHHDDGLVVIGISMNNDADTTRKTCQRLGLDWPQVLAPNDDKQRDVWNKASGITTIPRLFVIDREGVLQMDSDLDTEQIAALLKRPFAAPKKDSRP